MSMLSTWIRRRTLKNDLDAIVVLAGARGSCKSGSAISLAYEIDRDYLGRSRFFMKPPKGVELEKGEVMPRVVFTPTEFLNMISNDKLPRGSCIVFDEVGVAGDSREFMSKKNRMLKQVMETIRSRNLVIFLTAPTLASFDTSFRRSMSLYIRCLGKATKDKGYPCALTIPKIAQTDPKEGVIFLKSMSFVVNHKKQLLKKMYVRKPPEFLEEPYKRYKLIMQKQLYKTYAEGMSEVDTYEVKPTKLSTDQLIAKVVNSPKEYYDFNKKKFVIEALQESFNLSNTKAYNIIQLLNFRINNKTIPNVFT